MRPNPHSSDTPNLAMGPFRGRDRWAARGLEAARRVLLRAKGVACAAFALLFTLATTARATEPNPKLLAAARAVHPGTWAYVDLYGLKVTDDGQGLSGYWRGAEESGRQCQVGFSVRTEANGITTFTEPATCIKPLTTLLASSGPAALALAADCQRLDHAACGDLMFRGVVSQEIPSADYATLIALTRPACERGSARGCAALGATLLAAQYLGANFTPGPAELVGAYTASAKSCELAEPLGCVVQATLLLQTVPGPPHDPEKAADLLRKGCVAHVEQACEALTHFKIAP